MIELVRASWQRAGSFCASVFLKFAGWNAPRALVPVAAALTGALLLASCAGTPVTVGVAGDPYEIVEVDVINAKNVDYGAELADGSSPQELGRKVQAALKHKLTAELARPKTQKMPAKLEVVLDKLSLSSAFERAVLKSDSRIGGSLILVDKRTKHVISKQEQRYIDDDSIKAYGGGTGVAGGLLALGALAVNAAQSSDEERIAAVVNPFTAMVKTWLGRPDG
jgi:hypothetical protein